MPYHHTESASYQPIEDTPLQMLLIHPLFLKQTTGQIKIDSIWREKLAAFHLVLQNLVGDNNTAQICYDRERQHGLACLSFSVVGNLGSSNISIHITGNQIIFPEFETHTKSGDFKFEVMDAVDAHYLAASFFEILKDTNTAPLLNDCVEMDVIFNNAHHHDSDSRILNIFCWLIFTALCLWVVIKSVSAFN